MGQIETSSGVLVKKQIRENIQRSIETIAWDKNYRFKCEEGLGIRQTDDVDTTFLAKQGWKVIIQLDNI